MKKRRKVKKVDVERQRRRKGCFIKIYDLNGNVIEISILFMYANM